MSGLVAVLAAVLLAATTKIACATTNPVNPLQVDPSASITVASNNWSTEWNTDGNLEGWSAANTSATVSGGVLSGTATASGPTVSVTNFVNGPDIDLGWNNFLELRIRVPSGSANPIQVYYGTTGYVVATSTGAWVQAATTGFSPTRVLTIPAASVVADGAFHVYRIDLALEPLWRATVRDLRICPFGSGGANGMAFALDYIRIGDEPNATVYQSRYTDRCQAAGGVTPSTAIYGPGTTVISMESKHFRFLWNATVASQPAWTSDMAHGALRNAEEVWRVYAKQLGYKEPFLAWGTTSGTTYKLNITSWYGGYFAGGDGDTSGNVLSFLNLTPDGFRVDPPTWVAPHELMHCFQFYNNGYSNTDKTGYMPGEWFEFHANYGRERWLEHYQALYQNTSNIDPTAVRCAHLNIGEGREYYLSWPFFLYLDQNPDNLPDLGEGTVVKLWQQTGAGEYPYTALERITPTSTLKTIVGGFARRGATFNYPSKTAIQSSLAGFGPPLDNAATARWQFTDLVQRPDDATWWRVPFEMAPAQGAYAIHELVPATIGTAGRVITVNLHGLPDSGRGADWSASFIVIADDGTERYSSLWSSGSNSVTLAANENKVYLSVAGAPAAYYYAGADETLYPFRSAPGHTRMPYEIQVTGATPRQRDNGAATGLVQHANGGGYKASTASVASTVYLGPNARVLGTANVSGNVQILDYAVVQDTAQVSGNAVISGHGWVRGNAVVTGNAKVRDWGLVEGGTLSGNARVLEHGNFKAQAATDTATIKGSAATLYGTLSGNAIIDGNYGDYFSGRDIASAIAFGHRPYAGAPDSFLHALPNGLYVSYDFATAHDSRILDQYGVTDGFTIGSPVWVAADAKRKGFLTFDGSTQAVALDRSVADLHDWTFTAWVKPQGGAAKQTVLWLGASATQRLYFTPDDGAGHAKFSILNGGVEQTLTSTAPLAPGLWTHVAVTLDGATGTLYLNGQAVAGGAITIRPDQLLAANTAVTPQQNYLARAGAGTMPMYQGALDDVQFYGTALAASDVAALQPPTAPATAGTLYVDLRASDASAGAATWTNNGTAGSFAAVGSPSKVANVLGTGIPGVLFDGTSQAYTGPITTADIDGAGDRSIEVWAYNPTLADEESMVSWGYRGTNSSDMSFNFGSTAYYNAATHWADDLSWATPPSAGAWHHLVYTYDGNVTAKVYVDGVLSTSKTLNAMLSTFASQPINLACQRDYAGGTRSKFFGGYLNSVRVHGSVLTASQIAANYSLGPVGAPADAAPTLAAVADQTIAPPGGSVTVPLTVNDTDTAVSALTLSGSAANAALVPAGQIVFGGSGTARTVKITSAAGMTGTTTVTLTVSDGAMTASRTFNVTVTKTPGQIWRQQYFGTTANSGAAADTADPNGNGLNNLLERAFGGNPTSTGQNIEPVVDSSAGVLSIVYRKSDAATDLTFTVQECADLPGNVWTTASGTSTVLSDDGTVQRIRFTAPISTAGKKFLRVLVTPH